MRFGGGRRRAEALRQRMKQFEEERLAALKKMSTSLKKPEIRVDITDEPQKPEQAAFAAIFTPTPKPPLTSSETIQPSAPNASEIESSVEPIAVVPLVEVDEIDTTTYDWTAAEADMTEYTDPAPEFEYAPASEFDFEGDELLRMIDDASFKSNETTVSEVNVFEATFAPSATSSAEISETLEAPLPGTELKPVEEISLLMLSKTIMTAFQDLEPAAATLAEDTLTSLKKTIDDIDEQFAIETKLAADTLVANKLLGLLPEDIRRPAVVVSPEQIEQLKAIAVSLLEQLHLPTDEQTVDLLLRTLLPAELMTAMPQLQNDPPQWVLDDEGTHERLQDLRDAKSTAGTSNWPQFASQPSKLGWLALLTASLRTD